VSPSDLRIIEREGRRAKGGNAQELESKQVDEGCLKLGNSRVFVRVERFSERLRPSERFQFGEKTAKKWQS
jgi:hypothetical protein